MRSSRLISVVLLLQAHERMTTRQLAERFEVSPRTILRDVEALSAAGVPVHAERGRNGAIVLDRRSRLDLARLDPAEVQLLSAVGLDVRHLAQIGLGDLGAHTQQKLDVASHKGPSRASRLADVLHVDATGWFSTFPATDVATLLTASRDRRRIRIRYRHSGQAQSKPYVVDPYGLASRAASWYLVADVEGRARMFHAGRIESHQITDEAARLRPGVTLRAVWTELLHQFEEGPRVEVRALLRASRLDLARRILAARLVAVTKPRDEWVTITVAYADVESVRQLLQFGDHIQVLEPPEAVQRIHDLAHHMVRVHAPGAAPRAHTPGIARDSLSPPATPSCDHHAR